MVHIPADDPWNPGPVEDNYLNTNCLRGNEQEDSKSGVHNHRVAVHRPSPGFNDGSLGCSHLYSSKRGYSSSVYNLGSSFPPEPWSWQPAIQPSTARLTNWNTQSPYHNDGMSGTSSWPPSNKADPFVLPGPCVTEPAGHQWKPNNTPPAERRYDIRRCIEPQDDARLWFNGTAKVAGNSYGTPLFDLDRSSFTNDVRAINRTGCHTSDNLANNLSHTIEDRLTHHQSAINEEYHQEVATDHLLGISLGCHHGHRVSAHATENPKAPNGLVVNH